MNENMVSIIVPIYNVEQYLNRCVESIVRQTYKNIEIILVDDGSLDNCPGLCDEWKKKDPRIVVIHKSNGGLSDARNIGIKNSNGEYLLFVDSDDWIDENMVESMLSELLKADADTCACSIYYEYNHHISVLNMDYCTGDAAFFLKRLYDDTRYPVCAWNKLHKRKLWDNLEFPKGKICEDAFTTYLLTDMAKKIVQIDKPLYHYTIRDNSIMTASFRISRMDEEEAWRANYEYMKNHYPDIYPAAYDFYLQKVLGLVKLIPVEERDNTFKEQYVYLKNILRTNLKYILFRSSYEMKYKIRFLMDYTYN